MEQIQNIYHNRDSISNDIFLCGAECKNVREVLSCILSSVLRLVSCSTVSIFFLDETELSLSFAVSPADSGINVVRLYTPISGTVLSSVVFAAYDAVCSPEAFLLNDADALPLMKELFPDYSFSTASMIVSPMCYSGKCFALLVALYLPPENASMQDSTIAAFSALAQSASDAYSRIADLYALPTNVSCLLNANHSMYASVVTESRIMKEKLAVIKAVSDSDSPVLFIGENGTGREFFAKKLHGLSRRASKPFIPINCPAVSDALLHRMLFGEAAEGFKETESKAHDEYSGLLEKADGGTVFLRGIESLSPFIQEKLVRVLQTGFIERSGNAKAVQINARIIASTNCDLEKLVTKKKFRADLYYGISVIPLYLPPLLARREDIIPLAYVFLKEYAARSGKPFLFFSSGAEEAFLTYPWEGNARELKNAIACACALGSPPCITEDDLILKNNIMHDNNNCTDKTLKSALTSFKKQYVSRILAENSWNQTASAKVLDIQRTYLSRLIKELKIRER